MKPIRQITRTLAASLAGACCGLAIAQAPAAPSAEEVAARNAAAGFMISSLATLAMLRDECESLLGEGADGARSIAFGWWSRNRADIEVAYVWTDRYLQAVRRADPPRYQDAARAVGTDTAEAVARNATQLFRGKLPDAASCRAALDLYAAPTLDVQRLGTNPGLERFAEYGRTLQRIRAEPGYAVPPHVTLNAERSLHYEMSASVLVAQAAVARRDAAAAREAYGSMAERGDARAAYELGTLYMRGEVLEKDDGQAYRWFHRAWLLRESEAINALGVMQRDGRAGPPNARLALALFQLASARAKDPRAKALAERTRRRWRAACRRRNRTPRPA
ncbi:sel1 repeat family protein [Ramlibacter terrae]|uniref:Sel1 repeat family protein n=1 Tax=Ramlibacter terrae TaxID=2732511 RepID=A0ABX6P8D3_9BURK|nr:sel1 repeat family protein [Ramlibacter terrae]